MTSPTTTRLYSALSGAGWKAPVTAASTGNLTLSAEQTVDGVSVTAETRVLVKDQTTATENGVYVVSTGTWTRAPDFDGTSDVVQHTLVPVTQGTSNAATWWRVTNSGTITIDTTSIAFELVKSDAGIVTEAESANTNTPSGATAYALPLLDETGAVLGYIPVYAAEW